MNALHVPRSFWLEAAALFSAALLALIVVGPALGQAGGSAPCLPSSQPGSPGTTTTGKGEPHDPPARPDDLSNRLAQSDGVICPPPAVDPEMKLPAPDAGKMPVIPPPGSPGGDPSIRPK